MDLDEEYRAQHRGHEPRPGRTVIVGYQRGPLVLREEWRRERDRTWTLVESTAHWAPWLLECS